MPDLPSGTVTFLFTDIEGSTALWEHDRAAMARAVERHLSLLRAAVEAQLKAELDRLKFVATQTRKADESETRRATDQIKHLEGELARVHAQHRLGQSSGAIGGNPVHEPSEGVVVDAASTVAVMVLGGTAAVLMAITVWLFRWPG